MLRLLDFGRVPGLRSQTLWHAIAKAMQPGDPPVLSILTPTDAYVSIGFHRRTEELDLAACARRGLGVYRRRAGGGPVLCDDGQLFFQLIAPTTSLPAALDNAWNRALSPAVEAFRSLGAPASLAPGNDVIAGDRKVSGTGAAQIGDATVFVGNILLSFDHKAMADILALPQAVKDEAAALMRRYLGTIDEVTGRSVCVDECAAALMASYADAFGGMMPSSLRRAEELVLDRLDEQFSDPQWIFADRPPLPARVKIRSGVTIEVNGASWTTVIDDSIIDTYAGGR